MSCPCPAHEADTARGIVMTVCGKCGHSKMHHNPIVPGFQLPNRACLVMHRGCCECPGWEEPQLELPGLPLTEEGHALVAIPDIYGVVRPPDHEWPSWYVPSKYRKAANQLVVLGKHPMGGPLGPIEQSCRSCCHRFTNEQRSGQTYHKCGKRKQTRGPATDIRLKWRACADWQPFADAEPGHPT